MGQQLTSASDASPASSAEASSSSSSAPPRKGWCKGTSADMYQPHRAVDSVIISQSSFRCGLPLPRGPAASVTDICSTKATVTWSRKDGARKFHVNVLKLPSGVSGERAEPMEVAFFETSGDSTTFELPPGTLERCNGPYQVQIVSESGPEDRPDLSQPSSTEAFNTCAEPPGTVLNLRVVGEPREDGFAVEWDAPLDTGGINILGFKVEAFVMSPELTDQDVPAERLQLPLADNDQDSLLLECTKNYDGLPPGTGPYQVEVRAKNAADLFGPPMLLEISTACAAPSVPRQLRARLLPGWARSAVQHVCTAAAVGGGSAEKAAEDADMDIVKLEFRPPISNGGKTIVSYIVHAEEEVPEDVIDQKPGSFGSTLERHSFEVPASTAAWTSSPEDMADVMCSCHITIEPNRAYTFSVEACNGDRRSGQGEATPPIFVPARVPAPPTNPPVAFEVEGGLAAELRWIGPLSGGGLPLESFKIGIVGLPLHVNKAGLPDIQQEVTVPVAAALEGSKDWKPPSLPRAGETVYGARVEGLQSNAAYRFVLAASNSVGTGRWSQPSVLFNTPVSAPSTPIHAVATVAVDAKQNVVVKVTWESGQTSGSGSIAFFEVQLLPADLQHAHLPADPRVLRERVPAQAASALHRFSWAKPVAAPGSFVVEIVAESAAGQKSAAALLTLEIPPEVFPPSMAAPLAPKWAEEPVLVLGPAATDAPRFADVDGSGPWLQTLLLWHQSQEQPSAEQAHGVQRMSSGSLPFSIDVFCFFRRAGSGQVFKALLEGRITASRLQVALPSHVPMSLRLSVHSDGSIPMYGSVSSRQQVHSEPCVIVLGADGERLRPTWEIWSKQPNGQPPRWISLPDEVQTCIEASWLEGHPKVALHLPQDLAGGLAAGNYELTFGDERQTQSVVKKLGFGGWTSKARRSVLDTEGENAAAPAVAPEDQCIVCMERRRTHAFMHPDTGDGHLAVCGDCADTYRAEAAAPGGHRAVRTCPICRRGFSALQRIYQ
eukprot:TRINITY_DN41228_c0_g1_i1.p1 TRINITY_DN41228_c0_g1~~TRINITY_DN41228_c0_g1_i1.p1  ORF type:complete len:1002 (-),score=176.39 TRINITY_DN41228_c0_g1_i1:120-3125(-)